ncbi:hypothetical protein HPB52_013098 [Rhipicephalus sanguineus]|uniref:Uncharacterized protein n=1 Tax=Rhipicephalus sanguineus TaxID=34632 RepID=A0A9D4Q0V1_RHISA|nr:hypothetical protein HPB52_013098 [Rhipicephalus sanguineus]
MAAAGDKIEVAADTEKQQRRSSIGQLETKHKANYAAVFVPAVAIISGLALLLLYILGAAISNAIFRIDDSSGVPDQWSARGKARSPIVSGELWCTFDSRQLPETFEYPASGVCDAFVYCCLRLNETGIYIDQGSPMRHLARLVRAANATGRQGRAPLVKAMAIVGRRDGTPTLLKTQASVGKEELVTRIVNWVVSSGLKGIVMNYDNDLTGDYYDVVRSLYTRLHARSLWLLQVFDYNNEADKFSAGAFVRHHMAPVVRMGHAYLEDDVSELACPAQYRSGGHAIWSFDNELSEYAVFNKASFGRDCLDRTMVTASFRGYHYKVQGRDVKRVGTTSYGSLCVEQSELNAVSTYSNATDCLEVRRGSHWFSMLGPNSTRLFQRAAQTLGLIAFHAEQDDHEGRCGRKFPLLKAAKAQLRGHAKNWSVTLT